MEIKEINKENNLITLNLNFKEEININLNEFLNENPSLICSYYISKLKNKIKNNNNQIFK